MPLDPKPAITLAKIAVQAVIDDETRNKIIFISLAPIISVLLILTFKVYIITRPIEMIGSFFNGNELNQVKSIRSQYVYEQLINPNDSSYLESSGLDFSSFTDKKVEPVQMNRKVSREKGMVKSNKLKLRKKPQKLIYI